MELFFLVLLHTSSYGPGHAAFVVMPEKYTAEQCRLAGNASSQVFICVKAPQ